jgi:MinD superfamily P-loop ATPase
MTDSFRIAVASGKGGTGKTLVSTSLFHSLEQAGIPVTLVDCDAEEPNDLLFFSGTRVKSFEVTQKVPVIDTNKCTFCGKCRDYCSYNAIFLLAGAKMIRVMEDLCHGCGACSVACTFGAISEKDVPLGDVSRISVNGRSSVVEARMKVGAYSPVSVIKSAIREGGNDGTVIFDAPPGTSCSFIQTVSRADYVILVTEPTPFGLSDLKQSVETLRTIGKPCGVIVNRAGMGNRDIYTYLRDEHLPLLMEIAFDRQVASLYSKGKIVTAEIIEWQERFIAMYNQIRQHDGNSSHQR